MPRHLLPKFAATSAALPLSLCLLVATLLCLAPSAAATTKTWIDGSGQWNTSGNWDPSGQPVAGDDVNLMQTAAISRTVTYYNTTNPNDILNSLSIDATGAGMMTLDMPNTHQLKVNTEYVGYSGKGTMTVRMGAQLGGTTGYLGYNSGSAGTATVTGAGSKWTNNGYFNVGYSGNGALNVQAGGQVSNTIGYLGLNTYSTGTATVTGAGSTWTNSSYLYVGRNGSGTLNVQAGGQVSSSAGSLGEGSLSTGTATVTGTGSKWTNSDYLSVGYSGIGTLNVQASGQVSNTIGYLGYSSGSTGAATVTGAGSTWTNSGNLYVGNDGSGTLTVADGGLVTAAQLYAGNLQGNGTITVTKGAVLDADIVFDASHGTTKTFSFGTGGTLNVNFTSSGDLGAGYKGTGTLRIAEGKTVTSVNGYVGHRGGSTGTATVTGTGSKWTNSNNLYIGYSGSGTLNVEAGGQVSSIEGYLGYIFGSTSTATVTGAGSKWTNSGFLYVGQYYRSSGTLNVQVGGQVSNTVGYLGYNFGSTGTATVTGAGSKWTNGGYLVVGRSGSGTLNVQAGGQVSNTIGYLGYSSGSTGTATVTGSGSVWNNTRSLYVGGSSTGAGGTGSLTVTSDGSVTVNGALRLWKVDSAVTVSDGTLTAEALAGTTGTIRITDPVGGAALTIGSAASDTFSGTIRDDTGPGSLTKVGGGTQTLGGANAYTGATTIAAGTLKLASGATMASTAFDVGSWATFDVRDLSGGFTLGASKTLKGNGSVLGDIVVGGTVMPGASPGILTVDGITFAGGSTLQIELGGLARGTEYDVLAASGTVTLQSGSTLAVTLINGFVPQGGDEFDIMDFAGVSGEFNTPNLPALGGGLSWDTSGLYTSGTILVAPEPATLALVVAGTVAAMLRRKR